MNGVDILPKEVKGERRKQRERLMDKGSQPNKKWQNGTYKHKKSNRGAFFAESLCVCGFLVVNLQDVVCLALCVLHAFAMIL